MENKIPRRLISFFAVWFCWIIFLPLFFVFIFRQSNISVVFLEALVASLAARFLIAEPLKWLTLKKRPYEVGQAVKLMGEPFGSSFPSGHAAFFFALAATAFLYDLKWGILFLFGALIVSIARVLAGVHWWGDVIVGAAIGVIDSYILHFFM